MRFWTNGGFFSSVKGHVIKWWQLVIMPVLHINNDRKVVQNEEQPKQQPVQMTQNAQMQQMTFETQGPLVNSVHTVSEGNSENNNTSSQMVDRGKQKELEMVQSMTKESDASTNEDAMEILRRINEEKEEKRRRDVEQARKKAQEEARIADIMNANKVDVNAFIEAGRVAKEEIASKKAEDDAIRRAQEIMDRLNREAAEDEAKKVAEIEAAKQEAKKQFG